MFRQTCFGYYLDLEVHGYSLTLIHFTLFWHMHMRELGTVFCFRLNKINYKLSPIEFALMTELRLNKDADIGDYVTTTSQTCVIW